MHTEVIRTLYTKGDNSYSKSLIGYKLIANVNPQFNYRVPVIYAAKKYQNYNHQLTVYTSLRHHIRLIAELDNLHAMVLRTALVGQRRKSSAHISEIPLVDLEEKLVRKLRCWVQ